MTSEGQPLTVNVYLAIKTGTIKHDGETICFMAGDQLSTMPEIFAAIDAANPGMFILELPPAPAGKETLWKRIKAWLGLRRW